MTRIEPDDVFALPAYLAEQAERQVKIDESLSIAASVGFTRNDLLDLGLTRTKVDALLAETSFAQRVIRTGLSVAGKNPDDKIVTVVPASSSADSLARSTIEGGGWYARVLSKRTSVPQKASYLATSEDNHITRVYRIVKRVYVPSPRVVTTPSPRLSSIVGSSLYRDNFDEPTDVMMLDDPMALTRALPLGYRGVQGIRSYRLGTLNTATQLLGAPTA